MSMHVEHMIAKGTYKFFYRLTSIRDVTNMWRDFFGDFSDLCGVFPVEKLFKELYSLEKGAMLINYFRSQMSSWLQIS